MYFKKMFGSLFPTNKRVCGIEFDSRLLRYCIRKGSLNKIQNLDFGSSDLEDDLLIDGEVNDKSSLIDALSDLKEELQISDMPVVSTINSRKIITRYLEMPMMSDEELKSAVIWEAGEYLPYSVDNAFIDAMSFSSDKDQKKQNVLMAAAPKDMVMPYFDLFKEAALNLVAIDIKTIALRRWFLYLGIKQYSDFLHSNICLINMGSEIADLVVYKKGDPIFSRSFNVDLYFDDYLSNVDIKSNIVIGEDLLDKLNNEIKNTVEYFRTQYPNEPISRFVLTGMLSGTNELLEAINNTFMLPVEKGDLFLPDLNLELSATNAIAAGLSLRDV